MRWVEREERRQRVEALERYVQWSNGGRVPEPGTYQWDEYRGEYRTVGRGRVVDEGDTLVLSEWQREQARAERRKAKGQALAVFGTRVAWGVGTLAVLAVVVAIGQGLWIWAGWWALMVPVLVAVGLVLIYGIGMGAQRTARVIKARW